MNGLGSSGCAPNNSVGSVEGKLLNALGTLTNSYRTIMKPRVGVQPLQSYEVRGVVAAIDAIGNKIAEMVKAGALDPTDEIPF